MSKICGNVVGVVDPLKTVIIEDADGNSFTGVVTGSEVIFSATDNDVREGSVYASDAGVSTGTKVIPVYYASCGFRIVLANEEATVLTPEYDYDNLIITITTYDTSCSQSVVSTYISIDNAIYMAGSDTKVSDIAIDAENGQINLGITVNEKSVIRYFVLKEEY